MAHLSLADSRYDLQSISDSIIHPEQESADRLTKQINFKSTLENYQLDDNYTVSEVKAKPEFFGKTLAELDSIDKYHLTLITIIRRKEKRNLIGKKTIIKETIDAGATPNWRRHYVCIR